MDRRTFIGSLTGMTAGGALLSSCAAGKSAVRPEGKGLAIPRRRLGATGVEVPALIIGGVVAMKQEPTNTFHPAELANAALEAGIDYFDTAPSYGGGQSERNYGEVVARRRGEVFLATKTDKRSYDDAMRQVEQSLERLRTDRLDLLQIHGVRKNEDLARWGKPDGVMKALHTLRDEKVTRFLGVTGHDSAEMMKRAIEMYEFDTILTTFNPTTKRRPYKEIVLPVARKKNMGILAMKVMGGGNGALAIGNPEKNDGASNHDDAPRQAEPIRLIRYTLGLPISAAVIGMNSLDHLQINVQGACAPPLDETDQRELEELMS